MVMAVYDLPTQGDVRFSFCFIPFICFTIESNSSQMDKRSNKLFVIYVTSSFKSDICLTMKFSFPFLVRHIVEA